MHTPCPLQKVVLKKRCCDSMPLPLCTANLLVSSQWCLYGLLVGDVYIVIPNGAGVLLALLQMSLFLVFPRVPGGRAPLACCSDLWRDLEISEVKGEWRRILKAEAFAFFGIQRLELTTRLGFIFIY